MSQESTPTLSIIAPLRARLLEEMQPAPDDSVMVKEMKSAVHQDLQKRYLLLFYKTFMIMREKRFIVMWINFISRYMGLKDELSLASALDPRFKALPFLSDDEHEEIFAHLITITEALATEKSSVSTNEHWTKMQTVCTEYLCCVVLWNVVRSVTIKL